MTALMSVVSKGYRRKFGWISKDELIPQVRETVEKCCYVHACACAEMYMHECVCTYVQSKVLSMVLNEVGTDQLVLTIQKYLLTEFDCILVCIVNFIT